MVAASGSGSGEWQRRVVVVAVSGSGSGEW